jgi:ATP-binding cassette subfamily F protein uup
VLVAKLMLEPADVLLLDEPTNDLDIPTLEILEENLLEFPGALILVTHDRYLLNRVATTVLGLDGRGQSCRLADYGQWEDWMEELEAARRPAAEAKPAPSKPAAEPTPAKKKLSYMEAREFAAIEGKVAASDERLEAARNRVASPEIATDAVALQDALQELETAEAESHAVYSRWAELSEKAEGK